MNLGQYYCKGGRIELGTTLGNPRWLLAHELGHHLLGHCDESFQHEIDANAVAVRVLQVWGDSEEAAYRATARHLLGLAIYRKDNPRPGHNYIAEVCDLERRYPAHVPEEHVTCPR